ncbi:MAG: ankyrin repeat domain-containing protein [Bacteroidota bacterium]
MNNLTSRKDFLKKSLLLTAGISITQNLAFSQAKVVAEIIDPKIVNEFVNVAHSDFGKVKEMVKEKPLLLNSAWDWGDGDFETALGAAAHMGLKEMANFLISIGARTDIFVLTMLGKTEIVKAMLKTYPSLLNSEGPHGFTLLHHAEKGGKDAEKLLKHLQKLGLKETFIKLKKGA